jgi:hypothetical protein
MARLGPVVILSREERSALERVQNSTSLERLMASLGPVVILSREERSALERVQDRTLLERLKDNTLR